MNTRNIKNSTNYSLNYRNLNKTVFHKNNQNTY